MNDDLDDRLRSLGAHLDAERAAHDAGAVSAVVQLPPRRHPRWLAAAAAVILVLGGLLGITFTRHDPTDGTPATDPPPTEASPTTTVAAPGDAVTVPLRYVFDDGSTDAAPVIQRLEARATALGLDATVADEDPTDSNLVVTIQHVPEENRAAVERAFLDVGSSVHVRPVVTACPAQVALPLHVTSDPAATQVLPVLGTDPAGQGCGVGPALFTTDIFVHDAAPQHSDPGSASPAVVVSLRPGADGEALWNELATHCFNRDEICPTQQIAIEYGGWVYTAPSVQTPEFAGSLQIAGSFSDLEAKILAAALNDGPAPFTLTAVPG